MLFLEITTTSFCSVKVFFNDQEDFVSTSEDRSLRIWKGRNTEINKCRKIYETD